MQWQRNYSDNDGHALAIKAMAFASDGNIIAVGAAQLQDFDSGLWIIKVNYKNIAQVLPHIRGGPRER